MTDAKKAELEHKVGLQNYARVGDHRSAHRSGQALGERLIQVGWADPAVPGGHIPPEVLGAEPSREVIELIIMVGIWLSIKFGRIPHPYPEEGEDDGTTGRA